MPVPTQEKRADPEAAQVSWFIYKGFQDKCKLNSRKRGRELDRKRWRSGHMVGWIEEIEPCR